MTATVPPNELKGKSPREMVGIFLDESNRAVVPTELTMVHIARAQVCATLDLSDQVAALVELLSQLPLRQAAAPAIETCIPSCPTTARGDGPPPRTPQTF